MTKRVSHIGGTVRANLACPGKSQGPGAPGRAKTTAIGAVLCALSAVACPVLAQVEDDGRLVRYRQGAERAACLLCSSCGVLVAVLYEEGARTWATVNFRAVDRPEIFGARTAVSPRLLEAEEKVERWKRIWIPDVSIEAIGASGR